MVGEVVIQGADLGKPQPVAVRSSYPSLTKEEWGAIIVIGVGLAVLVILTLPASAPALATVAVAGVVSYAVARQTLKSQNQPRMDGI